MFVEMTIFQLLEWLKYNDMDTSWYDCESDDDKAAYEDFLYFERDSKVYATNGINEWVILYLV